MTKRLTIEPHMLLYLNPLDLLEALTRDPHPWSWQSTTVHLASSPPPQRWS